MKQAGYIFGIGFITFLFIVLAFIVEPLVFDANPPQLSEHVTMGQWRASFQTWAVVCVGAAGVASLLWYVRAQWGVKINRWEDTEKRLTWICLYILPIIIIVVSCFRVEHAESSLTWVYVLFCLNGLLPYYFATLLFSPLSFKYTPIGAKGIRSRCFW